MLSVIIFELLSKTDIWEAFIHHHEPDNIYIYYILMSDADNEEAMCG